MKPGYEQLKCLISEIYKDGIVFDNLENAEIYRSLLIGKGQKPGDLYCEDGYVLSADGCMELIAADRLSSLAFTFGVKSQNMEDLEESKYISFEMFLMSRSFHYFFHRFETSQGSSKSRLKTFYSQRKSI